VILYVNGDSHTAAAEAVNAHAFAEDDPYGNYLGRLPHPDNLSASWGRKLADHTGCRFVLAALNLLPAILESCVLHASGC
jgi:hypothetical protein